MAGYWNSYWAESYWHDGYWLAGDSAVPAPSLFRRAFGKLTEHAKLYLHAINQLQGVHGRSLTYTPPDGATVELRAVAIEPLRDSILRDEEGERVAVVRDVLIRRDSTHIRGGIELIDHGGSFVIDSETWSVVNIGHESETLTRVTVTRREVLEESRGEYRNT